jgi:hypothetical protein
MKRVIAVQNSDLKNSPIAWEGEEDTDALQAEVSDEAACFFNDVEYAHGALLTAGDVPLRCEHGVWVPVETDE